jgi:mercuric ion transport protein
MFLGIVTAFAIVMLAFPYYAHIFYPKTEKQIIVVDKSNVQTVEFTISGMTCASCEEHVNHEVNKLSGIIKSNASYENGNAIVEFDNSKTNISEIEKAINGTGYSVTDKKKIKWKSYYNQQSLAQTADTKRRNNADRRLPIFLRM